MVGHGIARITGCPSDSPDVIAYGFVSPFLKRLCETDIIDELRVIISDEDRTTAYFTFPSQMRPLIHQFRIYGTQNGLLLDHEQQTLIRLRGARFKSYAEEFIPPVIMAQQYLGNLRTKLGTFLARDFHMKSGMKYLIESFYRSIVERTSAPIPHREILLTARIMDTIFTRIEAQRPKLNGQKQTPLQLAS